MTIRKFFTTAVLAVLLVGLLAFAFPNGSAAAQTPTPQPKRAPQEQTQRINGRLEKAFAGLQKLVEKQSQNLQRADKFIAKVEDLIGKAKANGQDTSALEAAVAAFKTQRGEAAKLNSAVADIIKAHAGFDASGKVINPEQAKNTLETGHDSLKEARGIFVDAFKNLRETFKAWREANPPTAKK